MDFKTELLNKLHVIKGTYEDGSKLGEYAKGRYENTKMIIDIVKNLYISDVSSTLDIIDTQNEFTKKLLSFDEKGFKEWIKNNI